MVYSEYDATAHYTGGSPCTAMPTTTVVKRLNHCTSKGTRFRDRSLCTQEDDMHHVYRLYDADDALVYVGITNDLTRRTLQHRQDKTFAYVKSDELPSRPSIEIAEAILIALFEPRYNKADGFDFDTVGIGTLVRNAVRMFQEDREAFEVTWSELMR